MGGHDARVGTAPEVEAWITTESLDGLDRFRSLGSHADGAVLVFQGRVRETNAGRSVSSLDYEAYDEMAKSELEAICREAAHRFEVGAISAAHRVGALSLGEVSVVIGVAAPHRDQCYDASRWVIEEIKSRLPVWKHEHYLGEPSHWVGAPEPVPANDGSNSEPEAE